MTSGWIFVSPVAGIVGAVLVVGFVRFKVWTVPWRSMVDGGAPWSPYDSWLTNLSTLFGGIGSLWTTLGGLGTVVTAGVSASVSVMFVVCGGSAALAPMIYAALAQREATNSGEAIGTVAGLLSAAAATLFAVFGELGAVSLVVWQVSGALGARVAESLVQVLIVAAAACVCAYSGRTLYSVISESAAEPAVTPAEPAVTPAEPAASPEHRMVRPMSYFMTASATSGRRSATL
jgi:hypothetical protein